MLTRTELTNRGQMLRFICFFKSHNQPLSLKVVPSSCAYASFKSMPHTRISPAILYWGTPVVLISTLNPDQTPNVAPMSSAFWLADRCMLGLAASSQTPANILRTRHCVLNLPSDNMIPIVNALAKTTGADVVSEEKTARGYRTVKDKFGVADLTPVASDVVAPPRVAECPVQMEAEMISVHEMLGGIMLAIEVRVLRTWVEDNIRLEGFKNRVDADRWRPMIMSFQGLFGLRNRKEGEESRLEEVEEELYRI